MSDKGTKLKIVDAANTLFAKHGYAGASIRDIAQLADVNLAAVNYHFGCKEKLYWAVFESNYELMNKKIEKVGSDKNLSTEDFALALYKLFSKDNKAINNMFKVFLSDNITVPKDLFSFEREEKAFGPPVEKTFLEKIRNDLGEDYPLAGQRWASESIFCLLVHTALIMDTKILKAKSKANPSFSEASVEKDICRSIKAHLNYLRDHPEDFRE